MKRRLYGLSCLLLPWVAVGAPPEILTVRQTLTPELYQELRLRMAPETAMERTVPVGRLEKLELRVDLKATFENAYDPEQVDLWAEFTAPSGKVWRIWGFYCPTSWNALWLVRMAPDEVGEWQVVVKVKDREGVAEKRGPVVRVVASEHRGFVGIAKNKRYFQYGDGTAFYPVGLWYNDGYEQFGKGQITEAGLDDLQKNGANFISFFHSPLETMGTGLGRYDENRAGRLDEIFEWCETRDLKISWNLWFHSYISEAVWGGGNARYRNTPYRRLTEAAGFFGSEEAWKYETKLHRYIVARWGYSRALFLWFVVDEINGTEGWLQGGQARAEAWSRRVHEWLKANDPYGRPTTGTRSGGIQEWWPGGYEIFDVAAREIYELQGHPGPASMKPDLKTDHPARHSYLNYATQAQALWRGFGKPSLIGECGWDHTHYEPSMPGYRETVHNAMWAGLANGLAGTPFWWAYGSYVNGSVVTESMRYFSWFVKSIPFSGEEFRPVTLEVTNGDGWAMRGRDLTFGWAVQAGGAIGGETLTVPEMADGVYDVHFYRTWRGQMMPPVTVLASGGKLTVRTPELKPVGGRTQNLGADVAFQIVRRGVKVEME
jgi:hypothetical protein